MALGFSKLPLRAVLTARIVLLGAAPAHAQFGAVLVGAVLVGAVLVGAGPINGAMGGNSRS